MRRCTTGTPEPPTDDDFEECSQASQARRVATAAIRQRQLSENPTKRKKTSTGKASETKSATTTTKNSCSTLSSTATLTTTKPKSQHNQSLLSLDRSASPPSARQICKPRPSLRTHKIPDLHCDELLMSSDDSSSQTGKSNSATSGTSSRQEAKSKSRRAGQSSGKGSKGRRQRTLSSSDDSEEESRSRATPRTTSPHVGAFSERGSPTEDLEQSSSSDQESRPTTPSQLEETQDSESEEDQQPVPDDATTAQARRWLATVHGDTPPEWMPEKMNYLLAGHEVAPTTGRLHWQTYVEFHKKITFNGIKALGSTWKTCFLKRCDGSQEDNVEYCLKDCGEDFFEWGEKMKQGDRGDLQELVTEVIDGHTSLDEVLRGKAHHYHLYGRTLQAAEDLRHRSNPDRLKARKDLQVTWIHGPTGTGKTRWVFEQLEKDPDFYEYVEDGRWWCGYTGQKTLFIDEIRENTIPYNHLLKYLDIHPKSVCRRSKGPIPLSYTKVYITSDISPSLMFGDKDKYGEIDQLLRRIHNLHYSPDFLKDYVFS